jgi:hypothetical protein
VPVLEVEKRVENGLDFLRVVLVNATSHAVKWVEDNEGWLLLADRLVERLEVGRLAEVEAPVVEEVQWWRPAEVDGVLVVVELLSTERETAGAKDLLVVVLEFVRVVLFLNVENGTAFSHVEVTKKLRAASYRDREVECDGAFVGLGRPGQESVRILRPDASDHPGRRRCGVRLRLSARDEG